jgi:hypothetical protein
MKEFDYQRVRSTEAYISQSGPMFAYDNVGVVEQTNLIFVRERSGINDIEAVFGESMFYFMSVCQKPSRSESTGDKYASVPSVVRLRGGKHLGLYNTEYVSSAWMHYDSVIFER